RRGQYQVRPIRFQQVRRADVRFKAPGDQRDHVHEGFGRLSALLSEGADLLQSQDVTGFTRYALVHDSAPWVPQRGGSYQSKAADSLSAIHSFYDPDYVRRVWGSTCR